MERVQHRGTDKIVAKVVVCFKAPYQRLQSVLMAISSLYEIKTGVLLNTKWEHQKCRKNAYRCFYATPERSKLLRKACP